MNFYFDGKSTEIDFSRNKKQIENTKSYRKNVKMIRKFNANQKELKELFIIFGILFGKFTALFLFWFHPVECQVRPDNLRRHLTKIRWCRQLPLAFPNAP